MLSAAARLVPALEIHVTLASKTDEKAAECEDNDGNSDVDADVVVVVVVLVVRSTVDRSAASSAASCKSSSSTDGICDSIKTLMTPIVAGVS